MTDTYSLVFEIKGKHTKRQTSSPTFAKIPDFASLFDLRDVPNVPEVGPPDNEYWSLKNRAVMGKFKFEILGIGEIGDCKPKCYSLLMAETYPETGEEHIKTKMTAK